MKCKHCGEDVKEGEIEKGRCPHCRKRFEAEGELNDPLEIAFERKRKRSRIIKSIFWIVLILFVVFYALPRIFIKVGDSKRQQIDFGAYGENFEVDLSSPKMYYSFARYSPITYRTANQKIAQLYKRLGAEINLDGRILRSRAHYEAYWNYFHEAAEYWVDEELIYNAIRYAYDSGQIDRVFDLVEKYPQYIDLFDYNLRETYVLDGQYDKALLRLDEDCKKNRDEFDCNCACFLASLLEKYSEAEAPCRIWMDIEKKMLEAKAAKKDEKPGGLGFPDTESVLGEYAKFDFHHSQLVLARVLAKQKEYNEAETILKKQRAEKNLSTFAQATIMLSDIYKAKGKSKQAVDILFAGSDEIVERAKEKHKLSLIEPLLVKHALHHIQQGNTQDALKILRDLYGRESVYALTFYLYIGFFESEVSIEDYEVLSSFLSQRVSEETVQNQVQEAEVKQTQEEEPVGLDRILAALLVKIAKVHLALMDFEKFEKTIRKVEHIVGPAVVYPMRFYCAAAKGQWEDAIKKYNQLPEDSKADVYFKIQADIMLGNFEQLQNAAGPMGYHTHSGLIYFGVDAFGKLKKPSAMKDLAAKYRASPGNLQHGEENILKAFEYASEGEKAKARRELGSRKLSYDIYLYQEWYFLAMKLFQIVDPEARDIIFSFKSELESYSSSYIRFSQCTKQLWVENEILKYEKGVEKKKSAARLEKHKELCKRLYDFETW